MAASHPHYGKPGSTVTGPERTQIIAWIKEGLPRNEIAKRSKRSGSTISGIAKAESLEFGGRTQVAAATEARRVDLAARRVKIIERGYKRIEHLQDRLDAAKFKTILKASFGEEKAKILDFVPTVDERNVADTISRYVASLSKLELVDAGDMDDERSLLRQLGQHLGISA